MALRTLTSTRARRKALVLAGALFTYLAVVALGATVRDVAFPAPGAGWTEVEAEVRRSDRHVIDGGGVRHAILTVRAETPEGPVGADVIGFEEGRHQIWVADDGRGVATTAPRGTLWRAVPAIVASVGGVVLAMALSRRWSNYLEGAAPGPLSPRR
jgi:hypothetical protein